MGGGGVITQLVTEVKQGTQFADSTDNSCNTIVYNIVN